MSSTDWVERVTSLNQWRRGGERAPHKPLLLLYALGRLQRTGSSRMAFTEVEGDLRRLLEELGPGSALRTYSGSTRDNRGSRPL